MDSRSHACIHLWRKMNIFEVDYAYSTGRSVRVASTSPFPLTGPDVHLMLTCSRQAVEAMSILKTLEDFVHTLPSMFCA